MISENKYSFDNIKSLLLKETGCDEEEITYGCDIVNDLGCSGDDFSELIEKYAKHFNVEMSSYLWYFHTEEEGHSNSIGRIFFKTPYERVKHIPVTPTLLLDSANQGKWMLTYPIHELPKRRNDILINKIVVFAFIIYLFYKCLK